MIDHPDMTTRAAVDSYFKQFLWSIEMQEWLQLADREKQLFAKKLDAAKGRPPKGLGWEITKDHRKACVLGKGH